MCSLAIFRDNYLFSCTCPKCESQAGDPDVTSSEDEEDSMEEDSWQYSYSSFVFEVFKRDSTLSEQYQILFSET